MTRTVLVRICSLIILLKIPASAVCSTEAQSRSVWSKQAWFQKQEKIYLMNHVYERKQTNSEFACSLYCVRNESCASVNYKTSGIGKGLCELNKKTTQERSEVDEKIRDPEFVHLAMIKQVSITKLLFFFSPIFVVHSTF